MQSVVYALGAILLIIYLRSSKRPAITQNGTKLRLAPNSIPILGHGILFLQPRQQLLSWFVKCERLFGYQTLRISVPSLPPGVIISDPENLDFVFKHHEIFQTGEFVKQRSRDLFGRGILNVDGLLWKIQRETGLDFIPKPKSVHQMNEYQLIDIATQQHLLQVIDLLQKHAEGGTVVDLQAVFYDLTTTLMGKTVFEMDMQTDDNLAAAFDYASAATSRRFKNLLWRLTELFSGARLLQSLSIIKSHGRNMVAKGVAKRAGKTPHDVQGLVEDLLHNFEDEALVADASLNFLAAGRDTVAQALTWTFYLLMKHEHARNRLHRTLAGLNDHEDDKGVLTCTRLGGYNTFCVMSVFYEALRLYPPILFGMRQARQDVTLPDGTFLPKGSVVLWCVWAMNRSKTTWGNYAEYVHPERWVTHYGHQFVRKSASEFPVFNGGPRECLGKDMAEQIAVEVVATLVTSFDFKPAYDGERVTKDSLTLPMEGGLPVYVARKKEASLIDDDATETDSDLGF